jgi:hypothetical protein
MPQKPRVFISHSAKEPETKVLCQAIADSLDAAGFEVLWDRDLQSSQAWRAVIDEWIFRCDAAVLVLSASATDSRYVAYEAAHLRQRWKQANGQFLLVPVWCPGITQELLTERMGALQLSEIQAGIKLSAWPAGAVDTPAALSADAAKIAVALRPVLQRIQARSDVEDQLITILYNHTPTDDALRQIAGKYGLALPLGGPKMDLATALARHVLDFAAPLGAQRFDRLESGIATMMAAFNDAARRVPQIVNLVAPFCWVSPEGAVRVAALNALPGGQVRAVAWKRSWLLSERMYVYRGYGTRSKNKLKVVQASDGAGGSTAAILEHIRSVLAREVCANQQARDIDLTARLKQLASEGKPVFLVLPARSIDSGILLEIFRKWPEVCVFLFGEELDEAQVRAQFPDVAFIEPPLSGDDELAARTGWGLCMDAAGISYDDLESGAAFLT